MKMFLFLMLIPLSLNAGTLRVIGVSERGDLHEEEMNKKDYQNLLIHTKTAMDQMVEKNLSSFDDKGQGWQLDKISIGIGTAGEFGVGPYKFGKTLKQRFVYTR